MWMYSYILEPLLKEKTIKTKIKPEKKNRRQNQTKNVKAIFLFKNCA